MTTQRSTQSRARLTFIALASTSLLAASATSATALETSAAPAASPATSSSHQRQVPGNHRVVHRDARRDVVHFDVETEKKRPAPRNRTTDITTTVVDHQADQLTVQAQVRRLSRSGYRFMVSEILASDGKRYSLDVEYSTTLIAERVSLRRFSSGREVRCPDVTWSIDRSADQVAASVPTSCLGDPEWVRVGLALAYAPRDLRTSTADDSRTRGRIGDEHLRLGPRQHQAR